ncbi:MAG TPA: 1,4-beta-xylanase, partial [Streptomyces sp.]|nr:1,4-beta-xylanase [Streptomyces sp.]
DNGGGGTGSCTATYTQTATWNGGYNGEVTVKAGSSGITTWSVPVTVPSSQQVSALWNGAPTWNAGNTVMTVKPTYNGTLAAGASTSFGFTVMTNGNTSAPAVGACTAS